MFLIVPDLKNNPEYFEAYLETRAFAFIATNVGERLPESPTNLLTTLKHDVVEQDGKIVQIKSVIITEDLFTGNIIFNYEKLHDVDLTTKKYINNDAYFSLPLNTQKQSYNFYVFPENQSLKYNFERTEIVNGLEAFIFSANAVWDISGNTPLFPSETLLEHIQLELWVEPKTGRILGYESDWIINAVRDGQEIPIGKGHGKTTDFSFAIQSENYKKQIELFYLYDTIIPTLLVVISAGFVLVVFVNQNLRTRTKELVDVRKKKVEEVLYDVIPDYVVTFDKNTRIEDCNQKFLDELGFSKDELIGKFGPDLLDDEDKETTQRVVEAITNGKKVDEYDIHLKRKDGSLFHSIWNAIPLYDDNNEYNGFLSTGLDLTEIDKLRDELVKKEKIVTLGQLATNLAHDIKNPLASMKQSLEIIQRKAKDDEITKKESERANRVIKRIEHQVDQVLNYVKTLPLQTKQTTLLTILKQSLALLTIPVNISMELPEKDLDVKWDETQISVVFTNVILNAIQAIGKNKGKISMRISEENNTIKIEIENTGPNIPEKDLDKIFELLFTTKMEGTGLGLAGCKNIIQSHKGTLTVSNNPVKFTIILPKVSVESK